MEIGVKDAARLLSVSEKTIYRWISSNRIPYMVVGSQYRFSRSKLLEWVLRRSSEMQLESNLQRERSSAVSLQKALEDGGVYYRVEGNDLHSVLRQAVSISRLPDGVDREMLRQLLLERESLCSSGVGNGLALPHPRQPVLTGLDHPLVSLHFPETAVDFKAIDRKPVHAFFIVLSPNLTMHLQLMSRLSFVLRQDSFQEILLKQAARQPLLNALGKYDQQLGSAQMMTGKQFKDS